MTIYHKHHIVPRHMGGTNDASNLITLTIEQHADAHRQLYEQHGRWQDRLAWLGLSSRLDREHIRIAAVSNANKGSPKSLKQREAMSKSQRDRWARNHSALKESSLKAGISNRKRVIVNDKTYESCTAAARAVGISTSTFNYWINKGKAKFVDESGG